MWVLGMVTLFCGMVHVIIAIVLAIVPSVILHYHDFFLYLKNSSVVSKHRNGCYKWKQKLTDGLSLWIFKTKR